MAENTEYSIKTQRALSNYFDGLTEPVSLFIGTYETDGSKGKESSRDGNNALIIKTVEILRQNGIDAVPFFDKEAASPDKVVVSKTGLQTPFVPPEKAKDEAANILTILENNGIESLGFVTPNTEKQLLYPSLQDDIMDENKVLDIEKANPDPEKFQAIMNEHGSEFIKNMLDEALASPELNSIGGETTQQMDAENRLHGCKTLYKGATQGANVFAVISPYEARNVPHASPKLSIAKGYSGLGTNASSKGGATYIDKETNRSYGFIYEIEARDDQKYYANVGLETANREIENARDYFETPVMPHRNKVKAIYLHCGERNNDFLFKVPENDPRWQDFMALHEPSDNTLFGYQAERRKRQKDDAKTAGHALTYEFNKHQALDIPDYRDLSNVSTAELLKSIARRVDIHEDENGKLTVDGNVDLSELDIKELPKDFSNIKINGKLILSQNEQLEISSIDQLPETTKGIESYSKTRLNFGDLSQRSSEEVIAKLCGTEALVKNEEGFYPDLTFFGNIEKLPNDFKDIKAETLNFHSDFEFETLHDIPETIHGFYSGIKIKDQDFDNVTPHEFFEKTLGNRYMGTTAAVERGYISNGSGKIDGFVPEKLSHLDFSRSNIHNFPPGMEQVTLDAISLNPEYAFDSLDNFPKTQRGANGLNLTSVSEKETTESFLKKVWGAEYLDNAAHIAANGDIVVHNDLDLSNNKTNNIAPEAIPHDFAKVKVGGRFTLDSRSNGSYHIEADKRPTDYFMSEDKHIDLSGYTDRIIFDFGSLSHAEKVVMPKEVNEISFQQNKLPSMTLDCSGAKKLNISYGSDLSKASLIMPEKADKIEIEESTLCSGVMEIKNANSVEISNTSLQNTELHIEQNKHVNLQNLNFNEKSSIDCSASESFWSHHCDLSALQDFKLPESPQSQINLYETKLPKGDYDFSKYEKMISLNAVEFTPDSSIKLPQVELSPLFPGSRIYSSQVPECYQYGVELPGIKFPEMEWNLFDLKNNGLEEQEFLDNKKEFETIAFMDKNINLRRSDLSLVKNFRLPPQMQALKLNSAKLPECSPDLSGAKYLDIAFADFSKCDQIKFPEKINELNLQLIKFKDGVQLDVSGAENLYIHAQNLENVGGLKFNPEGNINISLNSKFPDKAELDFSKSKSVAITECDLSNIGVLRLPEGFDIAGNILKTKLPENVFIGEERYIVPKEEKTEETVKSEEKVLADDSILKKEEAVKTDSPEVSAPVSPPEKIQEEAGKTTSEISEPKTYKLSEIRRNFRINGERLNDPDGIIIDDRSYLRNKEMKEMGLTKQQRRPIIMNRRKENLKYLLGKIKTAAKNNKLAQSIMKLRGVNTTNKSSVSEADASHVIDFTETKEFEAVKETRAANNEAISPNKAKVSKRVKRIINIARGIIQPKKKQPATDKGRVSENDITRAAVTKEMANGGR